MLSPSLVILSEAKNLSLRINSAKHLIQINETLTCTAPVLADGARERRYGVGRRKRSLTSSRCPRSGRKPARARRPSGE